MKQEIKLSEFLKENGAYEKFVRNFDKEYKASYLHRELDIINAFDWDKSPENYSYWNKLDDKWGDIDDDLKIYDMDWLIYEKEIEQESDSTPQQIPNNNFEEFGFTKPELKGHIYFKGVEGYYYGVVEETSIITKTVIWNENGEAYNYEGIGVSNYYKFDLNKIELKWYEEKDKYDNYLGKLIISKDNDIKIIDEIQEETDELSFNIKCVDGHYIWIEELENKDWKILTLEEAKQYIFS